MEFPISIQGNWQGTTRPGGTFTRKEPDENGLLREKSIEYGPTYIVSYSDEDGNFKTVELKSSVVDKVAGFDVESLKPGQPVAVNGTVAFVPVENGLGKLRVRITSITNR